MGLDMFLIGTIRPTEKSIKHDSREVMRLDVELGTWRKHPNLHGFIVNSFAPLDAEKKPIDDCEPISLGKQQVKDIASAIERDILPHTEGFFFGRSDGSERASDLQIFWQALTWLESCPGDERRSVYYQASW